MKELAIIGAGPAGLTAAIYGARAGLDLVLYERFSPGGQVINTHEVENYPGFIDPVPGWQLMTNMEQQAKRLGVSFVSSKVNSIDYNEDAGFCVLKMADGSEIKTRCCILATGASFKKLHIPGEKEFLGRGVSYCATCDGAFFKDKTVAVIGGGDTALEEAYFLTRFAKKVYLIHRRKEFRGSKILQERVFSSEKIEIIYDYIVSSVNGENLVKSITMQHCSDMTESQLPVDGVFIFVGYEPNTGIVPQSILNERSEVIVDMHMRTSIPGLFAAGDMREGSLKQIVAAAADGATAAMKAYEYIISLNL